MSEQNHKKSRKEMEAEMIAKAWKDEGYKKELLSNPKKVIGREFRITFPEQTNVQVLEENPSTLYFVLPMRPDLSAAELSEEQLEVVAGGGLADAWDDIYSVGKDFGQTIAEAGEAVVDHFS